MMSGHLLQTVSAEIAAAALARAGGASRARNVARWLLIFISAGLILASFGWAQAGDSAAGIWEAIARGAPWWMLIIPLIGIVSLILLWRNAAGVFWMLTVLGLILMIAALLSLNPLNAIQGMRPGWGATFAVLSGFAYPLIAVITALKDAVPLSSPLARLVYSGRYGHLRDLYRLADRWGWEARGPEGPEHALTIKGQLHGRALHINSGAIYSASRYNPSYQFLRVAVGSTRAPWPFFIAVGEPGPGKAEQQAALRGACRNARGRQTTFYVWAPPTRLVSDAALYPLQQALESGRRFLRNRTVVRTLGDGILFVRKSAFRMTENAEDMERLLQWLSELAQVMETAGLSDEPTAG